MYATQSIADCQNYDVTREFLCESFKANPSVYWKRLTSLRRQGTDSYKFFSSRLRDLQDHYLQSKNILCFDQLKQDNLFHLFMDALSPEVKAFVLTHEAETPSDAAKYADLHYSVETQNCDRTREDRKFSNSHRPGAAVSEVEQPKKTEIGQSLVTGSASSRPAQDGKYSPEKEAFTGKGEGPCFYVSHENTKNCNVLSTKPK